MGIHRTRTIHRKPSGHRWYADNLKFVTRVPWRKSEDDPNVDGEMMAYKGLTKEEAQQISGKSRGGKKFRRDSVSG